MVTYQKSAGWRTVKILLLFLIILDLCIINPVSADSRYEADELIQQADEAISSAFQAVLEAEEAGANVSGLVGRLDEAASLLALANISVRNEGSGEVVELADRSVEIAESIENDAASLRVSALADHEFVFRVYLVSSLVGVPAFLFFMFLLWRWFKGFYIRRILRLTPEVGENA